MACVGLLIDEGIKERSYKVTMSRTRSLGARITYPVLLPSPLPEAFDFERKDILGSVSGMFITSIATVASDVWKSMNLPLV